MMGAEHQELMAERDYPDKFQYLIDMFRELGERREPGMGISPITFGMMLDYQQLYGIEIRDWEKKAIFKIDNAYRIVNSKKPSSGKSKTTPKGTR